MKKPMLLIQLIVNDSAVWQVHQTVDPLLCRNMKQEELESVGVAAALALEETIRFSTGKSTAEVPGPSTKYAKRK